MNMFVDPTDFQHIIYEMKKELPKLLFYREDLVMKLKKNFRKTKNYPLEIKEKDWVNKKTGRKWVIQYIIGVENKKMSFSFIPITLFEANNERHYLQFVEDNIRDSRSLGQPIIKIFRSHFISRFNERCGVLLKPLKVIQNFPFKNNFPLIESFVQNEKWWLYLHQKGVAMVQKKPGYLYFDTYISLSDLKNNQKDAIRNFLGEISDPYQYLVLAFTLSINKQWTEYFSEDGVGRMVEIAMKQDRIKCHAFLEKTKKYIESLNLDQGS